MAIPTTSVELAADELAIIAALLRFKRTEVLIPEGTREDLEHIEQKVFDALAKMYRLFPELENYGMDDEPEKDSGPVATPGMMIRVRDYRTNVWHAATLTEADNGEIVAEIGLHGVAAGEAVAKMGDTITFYPAHGKASREGILHTEDGRIVAREIQPF